LKQHRLTTTEVSYLESPLAVTPVLSQNLSGREPVSARSSCQRATNMRENLDVGSENV